MVKLHEECGVFGIYSENPKYLANTTYSALFGLQHRGQEACGIAVADGKSIKFTRGLGLISDVFNSDSLKNLGKGIASIGHCRYSTTGSDSEANIQPIVCSIDDGMLAVAHNGNITNAYELRKILSKSGSIFYTTMDSEVIPHLLVRELNMGFSISEAACRLMDFLKGSFSLVIMTHDTLIACRDQTGFRPLCMGKTADGYMFSSESCVIDNLGGEFIKDIKPGEVVTVNKDGVKFDESRVMRKPSICIFEHIYFARNDSVIDGVSVHEARVNAGKRLAITHPADADIVIGVPDSGIGAAIGFSKQSGIPYEMGFVKNKYVGRSFIEPTDTERKSVLNVKLNPIVPVVKDKRVVLVDDSIVRGNTCKKIITLLRNAGVKEIHMRISSPPFLYPCYFGTDIDSQENLLACKYSIDEICKLIGADSLGYLNVEDLAELVKGGNCDYCHGCFTGQYPVDVKDASHKDIFE